MGLVACTSTGVTTTWVAPGAREHAITKVMVIGVMPDAQTRYIVEDEVHAQVTRAEVIESYSLLNDDEIRDLDRLREAVKLSKVDGVIVVRLAETKREATYYSVPSYGFYDYYSWCWSAIPAPGWTQIDTKVSLDIQIFAVEGERRLWSGRTESTNPSSFRALVTETVTAVRKKLLSTGLIR